MGILHHRRKEIQRLHNGQVLRQPVNSRVIRMIVPHQKILVLLSRQQRQNPVQHLRPQLRRTAAALAENFVFAHCKNLPFFSIFIIRKESMYLSPFSFCIYKIGITYKPTLRLIRNFHKIPNRPQRHNQLKRKLFQIPDIFSHAFFIHTVWKIKFLFCSWL